MLSYIKALWKCYKHGRALQKGTTRRLNVTKDELRDLFHAQIDPNLDLKFRGVPFVRVHSVGLLASVVVTYGHALVVPNTLII